MDYNRIYRDLIDRARNRETLGYVEHHHILPKCMGGTNAKDNIVALTAREHFIAHLLLMKLHPKYPKLVFAVKMMCRQFSGERINNRMYEWIRNREAQVSSEMNTGEKNPFYGKTHSEETKRKISEARLKRQNGIKKVKVIRPKRGSHLSEETKAKIRATKAAQPLELKQKSGKMNRGRKRSPEQKQKLSDAHKGKPTWNKGIPATNERREKARQTMLNILPYDGPELCKYDCGNVAQFYRKGGNGEVKYSCEESHNKCPGFKAKRDRQRQTEHNSIRSFALESITAIRIDGDEFCGPFEA